jgi:hypothetical protein
MVSLRCPDCQLVLEFTDDSPTDLAICPACGAQFRWEPATGVYIVFSDEEAPPTDPASEGTAPSGENSEDLTDSPEDSRSPAEVLASIAAKRERYADEQFDEDMRPWRLFRKVWLVIAFLTLGLGLLNEFVEGRSLTLATAVMVVVGSCLLALGVAAFVMLVSGLPAAVIEAARLWRRGEPEQRELDGWELDEIAGRTRAKVIRRPRTSTDLPEGGRDRNPMEQTSIIETPGSPPAEATPPAKDGPADPITLTPPQPAVPDDSGRACRL